MPESLEFWVGLSSTMARQFKISNITSANINLQLNSGGSVALEIDKYPGGVDNAMDFATTGLGVTHGSTNTWALGPVAPVSYCILVYRDTFLVWSGPIWTISETSTGNTKTISLTAVSWQELLNHRLIRSQPGYLLVTSPITWSNATYESAVSGWTPLFVQGFPPNGSSSTGGGSGSTTTRDTSVFHGGAGSFLWSENLTAPVGCYFPVTIGSLTGTALITTSATPLSATPTAGKRYKLNLWMRARKSCAGIGGKIPMLNILEGGSVIATQSLSSLFNDLTYNTYFDGSNFVNPTTIDGGGSAIASFSQLSVEWVSSGVTPSFRLLWDVNPTQLSNFYGNWISSSGTIRTFSNFLIGNSPTGAYAMGNGAWSGTFETGKVYKVTIKWFRNSACTSGQFEIRDLVTGSLGSVSAVGGPDGVPQTVSFTFTAPAGQVYFVVSQVYSGSSGDNFYIYEISISENASNTDALINIDDVTLQEYAGDGIYSNMDAGAIATALLQKTNADSPTGISPGTVQTTQPRTRTYQQFSNVGKEIKALSDIESGYDYVIDPITRSMNIYNRTNATNFPVVTSGNAGAGSWTYSADRTSTLRFDWGGGMDNLSSIKKTQDASTLVNRLNVKGKYSLGFAEDFSSESTYGLFEDLISLPDVIDASTSVLPFYANAEIAFRKNPKIIYEIEASEGPNTPKLFVDFNIGDRGTIHAKVAFYSTGLLNQAVRIFGVQLSIDKEGNERLSGLQLTA